MKNVAYDNNKTIYNSKLKEKKEKLKEHIMDSFKILKNDDYISKEKIENWLNKIIFDIETEIDNLFNFLININKSTEKNETNNKKEYKAESNSELNIFTPKDIQEENKEITRNFQNETYNYMNDNEKIENENVATFLHQVARTSRISYNVAKNIYKSMEEKFNEYKKNKISLEDENSKKEFSSWIKRIEKENEIKEKNKFKEYEKILKLEKQIEKEENIKIKEYLLNLYRNLTIMYFHCFIAFPLVEINFKCEGDFKSEKMIDFINRGKNRKVNFVILPSLISNNNYLQNGKSWVFTFSKNTFKFENSMNEALNAILETKIIDTKFLEENLKIEFCKNNENEKFININTNINIPEEMEYQFVIYYLDKKNNKKNCINTNKKNFEIEKY